MKKYRKLIFPTFFVLSLLLVSSVSAQETQSDIPEKLLPLAQELGCSTQADCEAAFNANFTKGLELAEKHDVYTAAQKQVAQSFKSEVLGKLQNVTAENFEEELIKLAESVLLKPTVARRLNVTKTEVQAARTIITEVKNAGVSLELCRQPEESLTREQLIGCLRASKELAVKADVVSTYIPKARIEQIDFSSKMAELEAALANGEYPELGRTSDEAGFNCLKSGSEPLKSCDTIAEKYFGPEGITDLNRARSQIVQTEDYYKKGIENISLVTPDGRTVVGRAAIMGTCDQAFQARNVTLARTCGDFAVKNGFVSQAEVEKGIKFFELTAQANVNFGECARNPKACEQYIPQEYRGQYDVGNQIFEIMAAEGISPEQCRQAEYNPEVGRRCFEGAKRVLPKLKELAATSPIAARMVQEIEQKVNQGERYLGREQEFQQTFQTTGGPGSCRTAEECFRFCSNSANGAECLAFGAKHEVFNESEVAQRYGVYTQSLTVPTPIFAGSPGTSSFPGVGPYPGFQPPAGQYPAPGQYPGFTQPGPGFSQPPGYGYPGAGGPGPSPECFAAIQSGDFAKAKQVCYISSPTPYPQPYPGSQPYPYPGQCPQTVFPGPCPEGQRRDEKRDERGCYVYGACVSTPGYVPPSPTVCPALPTVTSCPPDQEKVATYSSPECGTYYECRPRASQPPPGGCPTGQYWNGTACISSGGGCSIYNNQTSCVSASERCDWRTSGSTGWCQPSTTAASCGNYICESGETASCLSDCPTYTPPSCPSGQYWYQPSSGGGYCKPSEGTTTQCDWANQYLKTSTNSCMPKSNCSDPTNAEYSTPECQGVRGSTYTGTNTICSTELTGLLGSGCHNMGNAWFNGEMTRYVWPGTSAVKDCSTSYISNCSGGGTTGTCPSGQYWYVPPGGGAGYCSASTSTSTSPGTGSQTCDSSLVGLLGSGCHYMYNDASGNSIFCDGPMTKSAKRGDTATTAGCSSGGTAPPSGGQREQIWNSLGLRSWIRADADSARLAQLAAACVNVPSGSNVWMPGAGDYASPDFGMPDPSKCQQASSTSTTPTTCPSGQYWSGTTCVSSGSGCGVYNDQTSCVSASQGCDWRTSGSTGWCQSSATTASCGNYICESGETTSCPNDCSAYTPPTCPSDQYWYTPPSGGAGYCTSTGSTGSTSCGTGYYWDGTSCVVSTGGTTCPSGQYWSGSACVSSTSGSSSCYGGQVWDGTACSCPSGQTWSGSVCQSSTGDTTGGSTSCSSDQYWDGSSCVSNTPSGSTGGSTDPSASCAQAGGTWDAAANYCQMPSSGGFLTPRYMIAHVSSILNQLAEVLRGLLK